MNPVEAIRKIAATASEERDMNDLLGEIQGICREALQQPAEQQSAPEVAKLVEALQSLLDMQDEDCRYDHQGYCQNHNLDHFADGCRVARARTALAAYRKGGE